MHSAGDMLCLHVIHPHDIPSLAARCHVQDHQAAQLLLALSHMVDRVEAAPRWRPMRCGTCSRSLSHRKTGLAVVIATPVHVDTSSDLTTAIKRFLVIGICDRCGAQSDEIRLKARQAMGRKWPAARFADPGLNPEAASSEAAA